MKPSTLQRIDISVRQSVPVALTLLLTVFSVVPVRLPAASVLAPDIVLIAVFYWTVHRPDLMRLWTVFVIGLLGDVLSGAPLGVHPLVLVLVHTAIITQHKIFRGAPFGVVWWAFALIAPAAHLVAAIVAFLATGALPELSLFALRLVLTIGFYPAVAWLLGRAQRALLASV
ncbi:MAG TPA: rod shape-determining protein MreD [Alphaproteobacteria bacterium]|nr:rod shape-determining protein MreD [Alphaproteobacteria bacterium]